MAMETTAKLQVEIKADVLQAIRQHARSSMSAEVCGVLIGASDGGVTKVEARIPGEGAAQGGTHVTFTHETWEHIYRVKDRQFPEAAIVGWYHSHPGFGVFLSECDLFIHRNFFSNPGQVAWVYDPHSDEEGCFIWADGEIVRVLSLAVKDSRPDGGTAQPPIEGPGVSLPAPPEISENPKEQRWRRWLLRTGLVALGLAAGFVLGLLSAHYRLVRPGGGRTASAVISNNLHLPGTNAPLPKVRDTSAGRVAPTNTLPATTRGTNAVTQPLGGVKKT